MQFLTRKQVEHPVPAWLWAYSACCCVWARKPMGDCLTLVQTGLPSAIVALHWALSRSCMPASVL